MITPRNLLILGGAIVLQQFLGGGFSGLKDLQAQGEANRQQRAYQQQEQARLQLSQDAAKQKDTIARQRYESGCVMVVSSDDKTKLTALTEGQPVIDSARNVPLSVGNIVCDSHGLTGEIIPDLKNPQVPIVGNTAFTHDREIIAKAMQRYQGIKFTMPNQK
jgi:hypothetical protein